jgi:hypothetical protein
MMMKTLISGLALTTALSLTMPGFSMSAWAQVTDQTDQSEEDWRKSRKKSGTSDIYRTPNTNSTGSGAPTVDYEPVNPVERLPSESRRHLMKERAKAIANSDDGDISDAAYVPSEDAKFDEQLMRDEQEAWDVIVTDMQGNGGEATSEGGPNKVAVVGENGATPTRGSRGGSTRTLQDILDAIKSGQTGGGGVPAGQDGTAQSESSSPTPGQSEQDGSSQDDGDSTAQAASGDSGDQSSEAPAGDAQAADAEAWPAETRAEEPLSPLERMRRARDERPAEGTQRSASDYLGTGTRAETDDD